VNTSLATLERFGFSARGGFRQGSIYLPEDCSSIPTRPYEASTTALPVLKAGKSAFVIPYDILTASLSSQPESARAGDYWMHTLKCRIRKNRPQLTRWVQLLRNRRVHILTEDWHGERVFFPLMRCTSERTHEAALSSANAWLLTFALRDTHPGLHLPSTAVTIGNYVVDSENDALLDGDGDYLLP